MIARAATWNTRSTVGRWAHVIEQIGLAWAGGACRLFVATLRGEADIKLSGSADHSCEACTAMNRSSIALCNLRAFVIIIVLAFHSVLPYLASLPAAAYPFDVAPYQWLAFPIVDKERWFGFDQYFVHSHGESGQRCAGAVADSRPDGSRGHVGDGHQPRDGC